MHSCLSQQFSEFNGKLGMVTSRINELEEKWEDHGEAPVILVLGKLRREIVSSRPLSGFTERSYLEGGKMLVYKIYTINYLKENWEEMAWGKIWKAIDWNFS